MYNNVTCNFVYYMAKELSYNDRVEGGGGLIKKVERK